LEPAAAEEEQAAGRIRVVYSGLRPGEKLYEELLATAENTLPTHHPRILIGQVRSAEATTVRDEVQQLIALLGTSTTDEQVKRMKRLVPEYRSHNSVFSSFDTIQ
jgi:FlaA1/EpsC-like NDP-sugar epimerase